MVELVNSRAFTAAEPTKWLVPQLVLNGRFLTQPVTGVQRVARALLDELDSLAAQGRLTPPRLIVPARAELIDPPTLEAVRIERHGPLSGHAWEQVTLPRIAGPDMLVCLGNTAPVARLRRGRNPTLCMVHDLSYRYAPKAYSMPFKLLYGAIMPNVLNHSTHLVTVSQSEKTAIRRAVPQTARHPSFHAIQNGGGGTPADPPGIGARRRMGLYVGSLSRRKNAHGVLRVAIALLRADPQAHFRIIGGTAGSLRALDLRVPGDVAPRLELAGQINDPDQITQAYRAARFVLFPSFYEASPLPPIEAMQNGCPVIASAIPSLTERCGDAALYSAPDDSAGLLAQAQMLLTDDALWHRLSTRGQAHAARFTWRAQAIALLRILEPRP